MERILIIGGTGFLGHNIHSHLNDDFQVVVHGNACKADLNFDATDYKALIGNLTGRNYFAILNFAALTDVDLCQRNLNLAYKLNIKIIENLVTFLRKIKSDIKFINISTDQLYNRENSPESEIEIINNYAMTKYGGELISNTFFNSINFRTNFFGDTRFKSPKPSFSDWVINSLRKQEKINIFEDIFFSPLSIPTLAKAIKCSLNNFVPGTYNLGSHEGMSKADFIRNIARTMNLSLEYTRGVNSRSLEFRSPRPTDMRMDCSLFEKTFKFGLPKLIDEIKSIKGEECE